MVTSKSGGAPSGVFNDCGYYLRWLFDHPERANGMNLEVAIKDVDYGELAAAFIPVTGRPARYQDVPLEAY
jgi:uncharacterized protein YbjT (DUF2867 family)